MTRPDKTRLRDDSTPSGYKIWRDVEIAASRAPGWLKAQIERTTLARGGARRWARLQLDEHAPGPPESYNETVREEMSAACGCDACHAARLVLFVLRDKP